MHANLETLPDILYAVSKGSQYGTPRNSSHLTAVKRIYHYLAGTQTVDSTIEYIV